jgi:glycosyltransferase involved in cell wall biosynthesis
MRLTVIIPLYNRESFIEAALNSLLRQRHECELDVLVVNDGSTDRGPDRVRALSETYYQIRMIDTANQGVTKARNVGLRNLPDDVEFVTFLDSDDVSPEHRIRDDLAVFRQDPSLQFTYGKMRLTDCIDDAELKPAATARVATVRGVSLSAGMYRTQLLREIGPFDESFEQAEDADYLFRAFESQAKHRLTDTICVYYRQHPGNITRDKATTVKCMMRAIHKSLRRRRLNPDLKFPTDVFDLQELTHTSF